MAIASGAQSNQNHRASLLDVKRQLIAARCHCIDASAKARRAENRELARRLHRFEDLLALELDFIEALLSRLS
jgi:hypothetical protein